MVVLGSLDLQGPTGLRGLLQAGWGSSPPKAGTSPCPCLSGEAEVGRGDPSRAGALPAPPAPPHHPLAVGLTMAWTG